MTNEIKMPDPLIFTDNAVNKVKELIAEEESPNLKLRVFVSGGGCSGFQYGFTFEETSTKRVSIDEIKIFFEGYGVSFTSVEQAMKDFLVIRETYRSNKKYEIADNMRTDALNIGIKIEDGNDNGWSWNNN